MKELRELPVDEHEPALLVLHEYHGGGVVEDLVQARLAVLQRALHPRPLGDVLAQPRLRFRDFARHDVEGAAQPAELVATDQTAARAEIPGGELLRRSDQAGGAAREQKVEHQPHRERERGHPPAQ